MKIIYQKRGYPRIDAATQRKLSKLRKRSSELNREIIDLGLGHVRYSELREHADIPQVAELLKTDDVIYSAYAEYERQTGVKASLGITLDF